MGLCGNFTKSFNFADFQQDLRATEYRKTILLRLKRNIHIESFTPSCSDQDSIPDEARGSVTGVLLDLSVYVRLSESLPELCDFIDQPITYYLVDSGTKRGRNKLIDNLGFTYNISKKRPYATYWQCTVCPQGNQCKATVTERDGQFTVGKTAHNHAVQVGALTSAKIV
ncbi:hypothetical protein pdam_00018715 [Pocillopora damicornis]|uniref:FLYWCH-type domain-containing protein n=1 Tax=Pocillopora damicornis TaxID=46731 RepID=A0A3M6TYL3_POCDA|nr:hypothetical protein pdam_00018715 [Pocillopora damicornis]